MNCPSCNKVIDNSSRFCKFCGATLSAPEQDAPGQGKVHVGDMFDGKWRVESKLGQGGMGAVFLAHDVSLDRQVAIKILAASLCHDGEFVDRFEREARLTAKLEHPNIVPIYAVGRFGARPFIVMKLLEGVALSKRVKESPQGMDLTEFMSIMRQLCDGLGFIHSKGFVHRDIKSANIHLSPQGLATILDFGIIRDTNESSGHTRAGTLMGTPNYMAPEQALGQTVDARTDLYALGCIAFEMVTGHLPFTKGNDYAIMAAHVKTPPPDPCALRKDLPAPMGKVILRMLAKKPDDRYQTAKEIYDALEKASAKPGKPARPRQTRTHMAAVGGEVLASSSSQSGGPGASRPPSRTNLRAVAPSQPGHPPRSTPVSRRIPKPDIPLDDPPHSRASEGHGRRSGKVEIRERPSRQRDPAGAQQSGASAGTFAASLVVLLAMSIGIMWYAWAKRPGIIPSKLALVLETQVRPTLQRFGPLRPYLPPVIGGEGAMEEDSSAPGRKGDAGTEPEASAGRRPDAEGARDEALGSGAEGVQGSQSAEAAGGAGQPPAKGDSPEGKPSVAAAASGSAHGNDDAAGQSASTDSTGENASSPAAQGTPPASPAAADSTSTAAAAEASPAVPPAAQATDSEKPAATAAKRKPAAKPKPAASRPEPAPQPKPEPVPQPRPEPAPQPKPEPAPQPRPEPAPKPKPCVKGKPATLRILAKPVWGTVFVDGDEWGATPTTREITSGTHEVKVRRGGYKDVVETVCVKPGKDPTIISVRMEK